MYIYHEDAKYFRSEVYFLTSPYHNEDPKKTGQFAP